MLLVLDSITKKYENAQELAVNNNSFVVNKSEILVIVGESGCGKTTLLKCIAGFEKPDSGKILLEDKVMFSDQEFVKPQDRSIGMIFQDYALLPHFSVKKNILYGIDHLPLFVQYRRLLKLAKLFKIKKLLRKYPHELSGGEQQRAALVRSLITEPKVLLMDEPFSSIDEKHRSHLRSELRKILKLLNITTIIVTHDTQDALTLADNVAIIKQGELQQYGSPKEIYNEPKNEYVASFFGQIFFFDAVKINNYFVSPVGDFEVDQFKQKEKDIVHLALRPESTDISFKPDKDYSKAVIDQMTFLGHNYFVLLMVKFGDSMIKVPVYINAKEDVKEGDTVYFKVSNKNIIEFNS